jgi:uncharacterized protein YdeI (YjbR/CyaY-like superfamily)
MTPPAKRSSTPAAGNTARTLPVKLFKDQAAWRTWLAKHHGASTGLWLRIAKKGATMKSVTYKEALDAALCYGWIDGQKGKFDEASWLQKFTPRGAKSIWSKINRSRAQELIVGGEMRAPGLAAIENAKTNGRWDSAYDSHRTATAPADFTAALKHHPGAAAFFKTLDSANRYAILWRIQTVKKAETRQRKIEQFVLMLSKGEKIHP